MIRRAFFLLLIVACCVSAAAGQSRVILNANPDDLPLLVSDHKLTIDRGFENRAIYRAVLNDSASAAALAADPKVLAVELDATVGVNEAQPANLASAAAGAVTEAAVNRTATSYFGASVRASYVQQPAATLVRLPEALLSAAGSGVIAIIDTGVDPGHGALSAAIVGGYDFTRETDYVSELQDLDPLSVAALTQSTVAFLDTIAAKLNQSTVAFLDQSTVAFLDTKGLPSAFGHGTMVAGIVHLVAPAAKIMPLKAFRADGSSRLSDIVRAVYYAVDHGAAVINMSFSLTAPSPELARALDYASSRGVISVASAGNSGATMKVYPAGLSSVIGVGSTNGLDVRSSFSNFDVSSARIAAPGEAIITTFPGNHYAAVWGTSFSTALVTGAVDLLKQARPKASLSSIRDALDHGAKIDQKMGDARLDVVKSMQYLIKD